MSDDNMLTDMGKAWKAVIGKGDGDPAEFREQLETPDRKLKESEEKYYLLFHNSPLGIFYYDTDLRITDYNERFVSIMQSTRAKLSGLDASKLKDQSIIPACKKALEGGEGRYEGLYGATTSGAEIWVSMRTAPIYDKEGKIAGGMGVVEDITERRKAEEALRLSESRFRDVALSTSDWVWEVDSQGRYTYCSEKVIKVLGYSVKEMLSKTPFDLMPKEEAARVGKIFRELSANKKPIVDLENLNIAKDGRAVLLLTNGVPILDKDGNLVGYRGVDKDITESKRVEEEYKTILRTSIDGFWITDMQGRFLDVNETYCRLIGYSRDELLKMGIRDVEAIERPEETARHIQKIMEVGGDRFETQHKCKNGKIVDIEISVNYIKEGGDKLFVFVRDITERKKAEEALRESEEKYRQLVERANDGIVIIQDGTVKYANSRLVEMWGGTIEEVLGSPFINYVHPDERLKVLDHYKRRMAGGDIAPVYDTVLVGKDGHKIPAELNAGLINYQGKPADLVLVHDITKRKKAEEVLKEKENFIGSLVQSSAVATFVVDSQHKVLYWNRACEELTGAKAKDLIGTGDHWRAFYDHPRPCVADVIIDNAAGDMSKFYKVYARSTLIPNGLHAEGWYPNLGGKERYIVFDAAPIYDADGKVIAAIETLQDLTERKRDEEALRESERHFSDIINFLPDATFVIDMQGKVIAWNRAIEELTGVKAVDMVSKGDYEYAVPFYKKRRPIFVDLVGSSPEDIKSRGYASVEMVGETLYGEVYIPDLNGRAAFLWLKASPLYDSEGNRVGSIESMRDITERKKAEDALRESERRFSDIINFLPDATFVIDTQGKVMAWNHAIEKMTGMNAADMLGKSNYEYSLCFYDERRPILADLVLKPQKEIEAKYSSIIRADHSLVAETYVPKFNAYLWVTATALYDSKGSVIGAIESLRDITEITQARKEIEKRLEELERFHKVAVDRELRMIELKNRIKELEDLVKKAQN